MPGDDDLMVLAHTKGFPTVESSNFLFECSFNYGIGIF